MSTEDYEAEETQPLAPQIPSAPTIPVSLAALDAKPDSTQIAALSSIGIPSLEISSNTSSERHTYPLAKPVINIGRNGTNDIAIADQMVSGLHLQIIRQGNSFVLLHPHPERKGTTNGLLYQGRKIRGDEQFRKVLAHGDVFRIGSAGGSFVTLRYDDGSKQHDELPPMRPIRLQDNEVTIGRLPENMVVLPHPQVPLTTRALYAKVEPIAFLIFTARI